MTGPPSASMTSARASDDQASQRVGEKVSTQSAVKRQAFWRALAGVWRAAMGVTTACVCCASI